MAKEKKKDKKGFWTEFKEFISRGNILDMAVGVIVGGAFTAIVTALCDNILKPIINWILAAIVGTDSLSEVYTFLKFVPDETGAADLTQSIYIDWGTFINAIINFLLIALVLFLVLKTIMRLSKMRQQLKEEAAAAAEKRKAKKEAAQTAGTNESELKEEAEAAEMDKPQEAEETAKPEE